MPSKNFKWGKILTNYAANPFLSFFLFNAKEDDFFAEPIKRSIFLPHANFNWPSSQMAERSNFDWVRTDFEKPIT
jgi:hypothetical protein